MAYEADTAVSGILFLLSGWYEGGILDTIASMLLTKAVLQLSESLEAGLTAQVVEHLGFVLLWASALFIATLLVQWMHKTAAD